jgi:hypothetical protein
MLIKHGKSNGIPPAFYGLPDQVDFHDLDRQCRKEVLYLRPKCHPESGSFVRYEKQYGQLVIECAECQRDVLRISFEPFDEPCYSQTKSRP